jgi:transposase
MVLLGVDPHKSTHTVVAIDQAGRQRGQLTVPARAHGQLRLAGWVRQFGPDRCWAVEDCRHVAGGLIRQLLAAGERVVLVPPKLMAGQRRRGRRPGKSDPIDALAVARAALAEPGLPAAKLDPVVLDVRLLADHREDLLAERTRMCNRLRWHLHDLDPDLDPPPRSLDRPRVRARLTAQLGGLPAGVRRDLALELLARIGQLSDRIGQLERDLGKRVRPLAPTLLGIRGVGELSAAKLLGETAGAARFHSPAAFAAHTGTAPIPASSGHRQVHRLNRGGNRQLNAAIHRVAVTQARCHEPARQLLARRRQQGDTPKGALRVLKRHLADRIYAAMLADEHARTTPSTSPNPAA